MPAQIVQLQMTRTPSIAQLRKKVAYTNGRRQVLAVAELADHLSQQHPDEARSLARDNVERARVLLAKKGADSPKLLLYRQALANALMSNAGCLHAASEYDAAARQFVEAATLLESASDWKMLLVVLDKLALLYRQLGKLTEVLTTIDRALFIARDQDMPQYLARLYAGRASVYIRQGNEQGARDAIEQALQADNRSAGAEELLQTKAALGEVYFNLQEWKPGISWYRKALPYALQLKDHRAAAVLYWQLALIYLYTEEHDKRYEALLEGQKQAEKGRLKKSEADILVELGTHSQYFGNFAAALDYFRRSERIFEEIGDEVGWVMSHSFLGHTFLEFGDRRNGERALRRSLRTILGLTPEHKLVITLGTLLDKITLNTEGWREVLDFLLRARELHEAQTWAGFIIDCNQALGRVYAKLGLSEQAEEHLLVALENSRLGKTNNRISSSLFLLGNLYAGLGRHREAIKLLHEALALAEERNYEKSQFKILALLQELHEAAGQPEQALLFLRRLYELEQKRHTRRNQEIVGRSVLQHEFKRIRNEREEALRAVEHWKEHSAALRREQREDALRIERFNNAARTWRDSLRAMLAGAGGPDAADLRSLIVAIEATLESADETQLMTTLDDDDAHFLHVLRERFPDLSQTELKVCTFIRSGLGSKEICQVLNVAPRTVETYRYRIRKKVLLDAEKDLNAFLADL